MAEDAKPSIEERENGPLVVKNVPALQSLDGTSHKVRPVMALCRCGASKNKPFCDGSHETAGFSSAADDVEKRDKVRSYEGEEITVHYNQLLCSHAGECGRRLASVFDPARRPWIAPDNGAVEDIKAVVAACPSGALSYSDAASRNQQIEADNCHIAIEPHGPYHVRNVAIDDVRWAESASRKKFVLCRCGLSANKPFCDGTHHDAKWRDDR
ncbi:MAG: CDGSH iron-sulfur domain-containing protein [Hyphomicrobiaceae bacterium]